MAYTPLQAATLDFAADGTLYSSRYADVYHSAHGALAQAQAVFMAGNGLPARWQQRECFTILETGFGQGLSFLATWQAWSNDPHRSARLHFISVEQHPFSRADLSQLYQRYPELSTFTSELLAIWPALTPGFHRLELAGGRVILTLLLGEVQSMLHELQAKVDAIYLDGFAPSKNPEMWCLPVFKVLWRLAHAETTLATYTVAGAVRRGLTEAGFAVEKVAGFASKRQMLVGRCARIPKPPRVFRPHAVRPHPKRAVIIGAGMAGCATAAALAQRGWQVEIFEAEADVAQRASGNHVGLCHATFSKDDNALARLSRAGLALSRQRIGQLGSTVLAGCGPHLQLAKDAEQDALLASTVATLQFPPDVLQYLDAATCTAQLGYPVSYGAWWLEKSLWVNPYSLCQGYIATDIDLISIQVNTPVSCIEQQEQTWHIFGADNALLARTEVLILANAHSVQHLWAAGELPLSESWRSVTKIPAAAVSEHVPSLSAARYLTPALAGWRCTGAAEVGGASLAELTASNLAGAADLLGHEINSPEASTRTCARPNSLDRLPLVGQLHVAGEIHEPVHQLFQMPRQSGLYCCVGFGSRGITWHALAAEVLACQLNAEPQPIEKSLLNAIDPARFKLRQLRKAG
ncbi:bifunctional tRNA (5-methylaminomethyl-2-thiouridine)(34)-methyltransferase MnmD/FAD-dependent 5-carboxymethylaminomethyl-2-thiouridine(34) oxidoreductase MnmC [Chitinibacter tainanensis]|uniref:bifunctional tRNA (5-methylaminomethyl-2-thiouridine)(34)-methyltransferase MnmD/FAD-dependent 5-carboxymethylaminomethyl-2-thiouridine(34) oxidoreductase MnmC n=1 Tax=Chitinibacter tainanensis TaxID=230667 RepID=UPI000413A08B|nr:bifunctional tRNA (5-methylaminomethyl-2-thiouridine)(34)-methyltransferase MnmD/FAD-dependent 5-carboxymethylaminomethyl-2-thiouridine(34) oxidoreductase MnmC [Chitinibacter tainanensis]